jgi:hypothetical protein
MATFEGYHRHTGRLGTSLIIRLDGLTEQKKRRHAGGHGYDAFAIDFW